MFSSYDPVIFSRILTSLTLIFHIIFATIGVGVPVMIALAEWIGIKRNDSHYLLLARRWARGFTITVAVGVVTGTAIGLQLSLLWPKFMQVAGQSIALPLFMETFAFFFEAIFLGIYLYTWDRFKNKMTHFYLLIPVVIGSSASAFFITIVNAFMNAPQGFDIDAATGKIINVQPLVAMFNPATSTKVAHVLVSAYLTSAFVLAGIAAISILRGRKHVYYKKALKLTMVAALIFSIGTAIIGDLSGKYLAQYQPEKLAAAEWHFETTDQAPLIIGGILTEDNEVKYGLEIPLALSILAHGSPDAEVIGINDLPEDEIPPLWIHYMFDLMALIGVTLMLISLTYIIGQKVGRWNVHNKWLLRFIALGGPLAMLAIEFGWIFAEVGRQPWILRGYMKTADAATTSSHVDTMLIVFSLLYIVLGFTCVKVILKMFKNYPAEEEIASKGGKL
ncbi:cytochrome ubiquinol oxidase subunit I [Chengkuizengella axinellae]|uniref:Cytochrome ubiquinol oxidase subunit I n=1 Tax=Chengkuizengella axinellae TaxID=3064388 RepID=A0ABT9IYY9_9BACL|nr:cytochrome ubiquinol oxidase subunit I [Chengkuizengella sp. 2205SS18-9]MDP5274438.1 cytochrome ubiquinol oxidase subunit I [Chengkuizengella sp. 2205SS18-9]